LRRAQRAAVSYGAVNLDHAQLYTGDTPLCVRGFTDAKNVRSAV